MGTSRTAALLIGASLLIESCAGISEVRSGRWMSAQEIQSLIVGRSLVTQESSGRVVASYYDPSGSAWVISGNEGLYLRYGFRGPEVCFSGTGSAAPLCQMGYLQSNGGISFIAPQGTVEAVRTVADGDPGGIADRIYAASQQQAQALPEVTEPARSQTEDTAPPVQAAARPGESSGGWTWGQIGAAVAIGAGAIYLINKAIQNAPNPAPETRSGGSTDGSYLVPRPRVIPPAEEPPARPDTSVGCAWGDRAYGTCQ